MPPDWVAVYVCSNGIANSSIVSAVSPTEWDTRRPAAPDKDERSMKCMANPLDPHID